MNSSVNLESAIHPILVVDADGESMEVFRANFRNKYHLSSAGGFDEAISVINTRPVAVLVVEYTLGGGRGIELLVEAAKLQPHIIGILMTEEPVNKILVDAINSGKIHKFVEKPFRIDEMDTAIFDALIIHRKYLEDKSESKRIREIADYYAAEIIRECGYDFLIGRDGDLSHVIDMVNKVSASSQPVLISGEISAGKELIARTMHRLGDRANGTFVKFDAHSVTDAVFEEALFGREAGGRCVSKGHIELADGGTIYIENIDLISPGAQFRLVELLRTGEFERVDGARQIKLDVRVIASAAADLKSLSLSRKFRKDLFEALSELSIDIPPLRARPRDITTLAKLFATRAAKNMGMGSIRFGESVLERLIHYPWPGNIHEMIIIMELAVMRSRDGVIGINELNPLMRGPISHAEIRDSSNAIQTKDIENGTLNNRLDEIEREEIMDALKKSNGKKAVAARMLGINRSTLYYRIRRYGLTDDPQ